MSNQRLFGLIGHPLSHSFSAAFFNEKFKKEGLPYAYLNFDITEVPDIRDLVKSNPGLMGLNVTVPYKEALVQQLDVVEEKARQIGAVNVVKIANQQLLGFNTDYKAFMEVIRPMLPNVPLKALVLGTGGASKAVCFALAELTIEHSRVSRKSSPGILSYQDLTNDLIKDYGLIINTTPLGNYPRVDEFPPIPYDGLKAGQLLFDLTYNPPESSFLRKGREKGCQTINGYKMLVRQAELSWEIWNQ